MCVVGILFSLSNSLSISQITLLPDFSSALTIIFWGFLEYNILYMVNKENLNKM